MSATENLLSFILRAFFKQALFLFFKQITPQKNQN